MIAIDAASLAPANASLRLSDAERDVAVNELQRNASDGRLSEIGLTDRTEVARRAVSRGDLAGIFADLPVPSAPAPSMIGRPGAR